MGIYIQYIYIKKIVVLASEPVSGRSRATELPCFLLLYMRLLCDHGDEVLLCWNVGSARFDVRAPRTPKYEQNYIFFHIFDLNLKSS